MKKFDDLNFYNNNNLEKNIVSDIENVKNNRLKFKQLKRKKDLYNHLFNNIKKDY